MNQTELKNLLCIVGIFSFRMLGLFMVYPILSLDLTERWEEKSPALIGIALGVYGLTQALLQIPFGVLSDRFGRKKLIMIGLFLFFAGSLLAGLAENMFQLIMGRALQGSGAVAAVLLATLADVTRDQYLVRSMALVGIGIGSAFLLSLVVGPILYQFFGLSELFYLTAFLALISFYLTHLIHIPQGTQMRRKVLLGKDGLMTLICLFRLNRLNFSIFTAHACLTSVFLFFPGKVLMLDIVPGDHWMIYLIALLCALIFSLPLVWLAEKKSIKHMVVCVGIVCLVVAFFWIGRVDTLIPLLLLLILFFTGFNLLESILPSLAGRISSSASRGAVMGLFSSSQFFGAFFGGAVGGLILQEFGLEFFLLFFTLLLLICLLLYTPIFAKYDSEKAV